MRRYRRRIVRPIGNEGDGLSYGCLETDRQTRRRRELRIAEREAVLERFYDLPPGTIAERDDEQSRRAPDRTMTFRDAVWV
jgi:hypothetical protein